MKKFTIAIFSLLMGTALVSAQNLTYEQITGYLDQYAAAMQVSFDVQSSDPVFGSAELYLDGNGYIAKVEGYSFYCDGKTRWTVDDVTKEVYIENNDQKFDVPAILSKAKIKFDSEGWPYELSIPVKDDIVAVVRIRSLQPKEKGSQKCALDVSKLDKSYIVTDLR